MTTRHHRLAALLAALALLATACGGGGGTAAPDDAGGAATGSPAAAGTGTGTGGAASGEPITVGAVFDLSGATADVGTPFAEGVLAYVDWLNTNGGIDGRPIELLNADYQYEVPQAEQLYSQYVSQGAVAFSGWGTGDTEALRTQVTEDEIPFVSASYSEELTDPAETPYNFVVALSYSDQMRVALQYINEQSGGEHVEVAVFHHDSPFGTSPVQDGADYIEEQGYDMGYQAYPMPAGATGYVGELSQAQSQGATYIIIQNVSSPAAQLARDVQAQGMDATIVCLNWCGDELFIELAGADAVEGTLGVLPWAPIDQADGDLSDVEQWLSDNGQSIDEVGLHFTQGWYQFSVLAEGIRQAAAGGEDITGPAIKTALEEMEPYDTPVSVPIDFTAEDHSGMQSGVVYEVQNGAWVAVSEEITP